MGACTIRPSLLSPLLRPIKQQGAAYFSQFTMALIRGWIAFKFGATLGLILLLQTTSSQPTTRESSRDLDQPWGGFTPLQWGSSQDSRMPWWGPPPQKSAEMEEFPDLRSQLYQGDILLPVEDSRNAIKAQKYLWPNAVIPYRFAPGNFSTNMTRTVHEAMRQIESTTCVRFIQSDNYPEVVEIRSLPQRGCYAVVGRRPGKKILPMNLQYPECFHSRGIITHELMHVVGLLHEQARVDRDEHVIVHYDNIDSTYWSEFAKVRTKEISTYDLPYDYKSIMHYPNWAFSKNGKPTITAKGHPNMELGQRKAPTHVDVTKVRRMYNCSGAYYY